jgi:hypothetical protein
MCAYNGKEVIAFKELTRGLIASEKMVRGKNRVKRKIGNSREEVRAAADMIMYKAVRYLLLAEIFDRI